jgi:hypothetical protein
MKNTKRYLLKQWMNNKRNKKLLYLKTVDMFSYSGHVECIIMMQNCGLSKK